MLTIKKIRKRISDSKEEKREVKQHGYIHVVIGASRLGFHIAQRHAKRRLYVIMVDKNPEAKDRLGENFTGAFVCGDATKTSTLEEANIRAACEVVIVTDDDDTNILIANIIYAKYNKTNIVVRVDDENKHHLILCPSAYIINPYIDSIAEYIQAYRLKEGRGKK